MIRTGRILLVEPEESRRADLVGRLAACGHDVAAVPNGAQAEVLLDEGLDPDVVLVRTEDGRLLRHLAPRAAYVGLGDPADAEGQPPGDRRHPSRRAMAPPDVVRRVEEALLEHAGPGESGSDARLAIDLARRLANSLPYTRGIDERIDLLSESFHASFGVHGSLVLRRGPGPDDGMEIDQGLTGAATTCISAEMSRRASARDIRPFLARIRVGEEDHDVACVAVHRGETEVDLALDLDRAPDDPILREALMNLVGSSLRAAITVERLEKADSAVEAERPAFDKLLELSRSFSGFTQRAALCERILAAVHRHLDVTRSAIFLAPASGLGLFSLEAVSGFGSIMLRRIGLSGRHGVGRETLQRGGPCRVAEVPAEGAGIRETQMLGDAGLHWAVPLPVPGREPGLVMFGTPRGEAGFDHRAERTVQALVGAAGVALRNLVQFEELRALSLGSLRSLAAAAELDRERAEGHADRVAAHAARLGRALGLSPEDLRQLSHCALLHDVGKIGIAADAAADSEAMRKHPVRATRILAPARPPAAVLLGVEQHHERWDGHGYPYGLREGSIHLFARIIAIANACDHHSEDPGGEEPMRRLELGAGLLFDPGLVALFAAEAGRDGSRDVPSTPVSIEEIVGA